MTPFGRRRRSAMVVSYPSNPTAQVVDLDFYKDVVALREEARRCWCCPISPIRRSISSDNPPPSILQVEGAKEIVVEFNSLSKTYAMPGWRMGFAVGNER